MQVKSYAEESSDIRAFREQLQNPERTTKTQPQKVLAHPSSEEVLGIMKRLLQQ